MSDLVNEDLLDRAQICLDYFDNHPSGYQSLLSRAITNGDLDEIRHFVAIIEGVMAQDYIDGEFGND